jgi:hypothetical protein
MNGVIIDRNNRAQMFFTNMQTHVTGKVVGVLAVVVGVKNAKNLQAS